MCVVDCGILKFYRSAGQGWLMKYTVENDCTWFLVVEFHSGTSWNLMHSSIPEVVCFKSIVVVLLCCRWKRLGHFLEILRSSAHVSTGGRKIWRPYLISEPFCAHGQQSRRHFQRSCVKLSRESLFLCLLQLGTSDNKKRLPVFLHSAARSAASAWDVGFLKWLRAVFAAEGLKKLLVFVPLQMRFWGFLPSRSAEKNKKKQASAGSERLWPVISVDVGKLLALLKCYLFSS